MPAPVILVRNAGYNLSSNMALTAECSWISISNDVHCDATLMLNYLFDRLWDAGIGYGGYKRHTDTGDLFNSIEYNVVLLNLGYMFQVAHRRRR